MQAPVLQPALKQPGESEPTKLGLPPPPHLGGQQHQEPLALVLQLQHGVLCRGHEGGHALLHCTGREGGGCRPLRPAALVAAGLRAPTCRIQPVYEGHDLRHRPRLLLRHRLVLRDGGQGRLALAAGAGHGSRSGVATGRSE